LPGDSTKATDPLVLVEVLSPDSGTRDRVTKLQVAIGAALPDCLA
jgi:hypothetical protein